MKKIALLLTMVLMVQMLGFPASTVQGDNISFKLNVEPGNSMCRLSWDTVPDARGYFIHRRTGEGGEYQLMNITPWQGNVYLDMNTLNQSIQCYYVTAASSTGDEYAKSNETCVTPDENNPTFAQACKLQIIFQVGSSYYHVNSVRKTMKSPVVVKENRTFLLFRHVVEEIGGTISWDGTEKRVDIEYKSIKIQLWISKSKAKVNGKEVDIDPTNPRVSPFIYNGYTYVPLRFPVSALGEGEVKWYGDTKQAVLSFPDRCDEVVEGVLSNWAADTQTGVVTDWNSNNHNVHIANTVDYKPIVGDCIKVTGRNDNPDYPGMIDASKVELIPCPQTGTGTWEGTVVSVDTSKPSFVLETSKGKLTVKSDTTDNMSGFIRRLLPGLCVRVGGTISSDNIITAQTIEKIDCFRDSNNYNCNGKWISGTVSEIDCTDGIIVLKPLEGNSLKASIPSNIHCENILSGQCFRACITTSGNNTVVNYLFTFDCDHPECQGTYLKGTLQPLDSDPYAVGISQGETYTKVVVEGLDYKTYIDAKCVEACIIKSGDRNIALWIRPLPENECSGCIQTILVKAIRVDCPNKTLYAEEIGKNRTIKIGFDSPLFCTMEPGQCYAVCVDPKLDYPVASSFEKVECPNPCGGETITGLVKSIDCSKQNVTLLTDKGEKIYRVTRELCSTLTIKSCIKACVGVDTAGNMSIVSFTQADPSECPVEQPKECTGVTIKAKVISVDCKGGTIKVYVIESPYGSGMTMELPFDSSYKSICEKLVAGKCYKVCADVSNMYKPKLISMEEIPCPEEKPVCNKKISGKIGDMDCATNGRLVIEAAGSKTLINIKDILPCKDFKVGDCVEACVYDVPGVTPILVSLTKLDPSACEQQQPCKTVFGTVLEIDCNSGLMVLKTSDGIIKAKSSEKDICKSVQKGLCVEACIDTTTDPYTIQTIRTADPGRCPQECDQTVKIHVESVSCDNHYVTGTEILTIEARTPRQLKISFTDNSFCRMLQGHCYSVCVSVSSDNSMTGNKFKEIRCDDTNDCTGRTVDTKIEKLNCDAGKVTVIVDGQLISFGMDIESCSTLKPGLCVRVCLSKDAAGAYVGRIIKILGDTDCQTCSCNGKIIRGTVTEYNPDINVAIITDTEDNQLKTLINDEGKQLQEFDCIKACMVYNAQKDVWIASNISFLPTEECKSCTGNVHRGVIQSLDCENGLMVIRIGDLDFDVKYDSDLCASYFVGDLVVFCGELDKVNNRFIAQWMRQVDRTQCQVCKGRKLVGKIDKYQTEGLTEIITASGMISFHTDNKDFIALMTNGGCFEVCLRWNPGSKQYELMSITQAPPSVCDNIKFCSGKMFKGTVMGQNCDKGILKVQINGNIWQVNVSKTDAKCSDFGRGMCVEICGNYDTSTTAITGINADFIRKLSDEECSSVELEIIEGILRRIDNTNKKAILEQNGLQTPLWLTSTDGLKGGYCYRCWGYYKPDGSFVVQDILELDADECKWSCDGDTIIGHILDYNGDGTATFIAGDQTQKIKLSDVAQELLKKWAPQYFPLCVKICLKKSVTASTVSLPVVNYMIILPASECTSVCSGRTLHGTIDSLDCNSGKITIVDGQGAKQVITVNPGTCNRFKVGMCVKICLSMAGKLSDGTYEGVWVEEDANSCGQTCTKMTASVYEVSCSSSAVTLKCYVKDGTRYTLTLNAADCRTYQAAKCISFCLETKDGKTTGKIVGKVEVLQSSSCADIPDPCDGKVVWNAKLTRADCTNGVLYLDHGGKSKKVGILTSLCKELTSGNCYEFCLSYSNGSYTVVFFKNSSKCELSCVQIKVAQWDSTNRLLIGYGSRQEKIVIAVPMDVNSRFAQGMCINACGLYDGDTLMAQWIDIVECPKPVSFTGVISRVNCDSRICYVTSGNAAYKVILPADTNCNSLKPEMCVSVEGTIDTSNNVTATTFTVIECPKTWNMYIFDVVCNADKPYAIARYGQTFYTVYLPTDFNCYTLKENICATVTGYLKQGRSTVAVVSYIEAVSIETFTCRGSGPYTAKVVATSCTQRYIQVEIDGITYKLFYPSSFDCTSVNRGDCVSFYGEINQGYIDCYKIQKVDCPSEGKTYKFWITEDGCANGYYMGYVDGHYYKVDVPDGMNCGFGEGSCTLVTGTIDTSTDPDTIKASKITYDRCPSKSTFTVTVTSVSRRMLGGAPPYLKVSYGNGIYVLVGPQNLDDFDVGDCLSVDGMFNGSYIYALEVSKTECLPGNGF